MNSPAKATSEQEGIVETKPSNQLPPQTAAGATVAPGRGWWRAIKRELSRKTEPSVFITLIILDKVARAALAILLGIGLLELLHSLAPIQFLQQLVNELYLGAISRSVEVQLEKLANLPHGTLVRLAIGAYGYAALELVEGIGLFKRRRWAEYLTLLATLIPIPFIEIPELVAKFTVIRVSALEINIAIVIYLIIARKLFRIPPEETLAQEQPTTPPSAKPSAEEPLQ
jgi:uncharacterized membrane protein (DUF2068 family)